MRFTASGLAALSLLAASGSAHAAVAFYLNASAFGMAAPYASMVEDFESVSGGQLDVGLASLSRASGTYSPISGGAGNVYVSSAGYTNFGAGNNPTTSKVLTANGDEAFEGVMAGAYKAMGMNVLLNDLGPATLRFYSGADLVATIVWLSDSSSANNYAFGGIISDQLITRFTFVSTLGGRLNTGIDNIVAGAPGGVPEPSTWALMIAGFGLAGAGLRRRRLTA